MIPVLADFPAIFRSCNVDRFSSNAKKKNIPYTFYLCGSMYTVVMV